MLGIDVAACVAITRILASAVCVCVVAAGPVFDGNLLRSASDSTSA